MKKFFIAAAIVALLLGLLAGVAAWGTRAAKALIEERRHDIAGLALDIGGYELDWKLAQLVLKDIRIYPAGREDEASLLASAEELVVRVAPMALWRNTLHARRITLKKPKIVYAITGRKTANWDALDLGNAEPKQEAAAPAGGDRLRVVVDDVRIEDGAIDYRNETRRQRLALAHVDIEIEGIEPATSPGDLPTSFDLKASVGEGGGKIAVAGRADLFGSGISFELTGQLASTPLATFAPFYAGAVPFPIAAGSVAVASRLHARENILTSSHHATIAGLRLGGGTKAQLINRYILSQQGPIGIDASVSGDLASGDLSVSAALSKSLADELARRAATAGTQMAIDKLKEYAPGAARAIPSAPLEKGIKSLFPKR